MRNVDARLLMEKMDEVRHCNSAHQTGETVHVDANNLALNVDRVTVMHGHGYSSQMSRQVSVSEHVGDGQWNEELLSAERLEALVANLAQHSRPTHHFTHHKVPAGRADIDRYLANVILDPPPRLLTGHPLDPQQDAIVVEVPSLPPLPPLQEMKRCQEANWFNKSKTADNTILSEPTELDLGVSASPAHSKQQNKKSLPHKKRISRKLKRNTGNTTPQQELVVLNCGDEPPQEEILPDSFAAAPHAPAHPHPHGHGHGHAHPLPPTEHHIAHEMRPMLICQLCGEFYGEEQLKFYQHLKQHYEPPSTIIIENPVPGPELAMDKMTNTCIVDNVATLPDSIVELSLEGNKTMYQQIDKHVLYTTSDKSFYSSKVHYTMSSMDKAASPPPEPAKAEIYDQLELYSCSKCNKSFRKQKHCEDHIKDAHSNHKLEDMGEFSEPEDLMAGIHVAVEDAEHYEATLLPHLTVDNGHVHQDHVADHARHWYLRGSSPALGPCPPGADDGYCPVCPAPAPAPAAPTPAPAPARQERQDRQDRQGQGPLGETHQLKAEVLQRILDAEVPDVGFADAAMDGPSPRAPLSPPPTPKAVITGLVTGDKKKHKRFECTMCARVFVHRNSLLYHALSHGRKQHACRDCGKGFYTQGALKIHRRVHNGDRPYKCDDCGRLFRQWSDLKYHRVSLHSLEKNFKCEFCDKEFARKYSLNVHRRIHTGEKNYKCDYCSKTFRASSYRLSHMRTHTGDRPYKCTQCDKCFRVAGDLRRHTLTHDKVRNRYVEHRKPKDEKPKKTKDIKTEVDDSPKLKKLAANITKAVDQLVNNEKTVKPRSRRIKKEGAPNVTITNNKDAQFKVNTGYDNVDVYDTRQVEYNKFKEVYSEGVGYNKEDIDYKGKEYEEQMIYKESDQRMNEERELAMLKPIFRNNVCNDGERQVEYRSENTDGKMQIFTHVEKNFSLGSNSVTLEDIRNIERERELHGEPIENGFLDKLTAFYNIPAV